MGFVNSSPDLQEMLKIFFRKNETIQLRNLGLYDLTDNSLFEIIPKICEDILMYPYIQIRRIAAMI